MFSVSVRKQESGSPNPLAARYFFSGEHTVKPLPLPQHSLLILLEESLILSRVYHMRVQPSYLRLHRLETAKSFPRLQVPLPRFVLYVQDRDITPSLMDNIEFAGKKVGKAKKGRAKDYLGVRGRGC